MPGFYKEKLSGTFQIHLRNVEQSYYTDTVATKYICAYYNSQNTEHGGGGGGVVTVASSLP